MSEMSRKNQERLLYLASPIGLLVIGQLLLMAGFGDRRFIPFEISARISRHLDGHVNFSAQRHFAHGVNAQRTDQPDRFVLDETLHILAADQWNLLAETCAIGLDQDVAVY